MTRDGGERQRDLLRGYLLGALSDRETARLAARLAEDAALRAELDAEREALEILGALAEESPPEGLAERTVQRILETPQPEEIRPWTEWVLAPRSWALALPVLLVAVLLVVVVGHSQRSAQRSASAGNLKQMALIYKMYAGENRGKYPPVAPYAGVWAPDLRALYPDFLTDPQALVNPRLPHAKRTLSQLRDALEAAPPRWEEACRIAARNYTYTGWAITEEAQLPEVLERYRLLAKVGDFDRDIAGKGKAAPRLREGVERFFITDINNPAAGAGAQSDLPIMFEVLYPAGDARQPVGCNVLYMDGHVEFIGFGEAFPVLPSVGEAFPPPAAP